MARWLCGKELGLVGYMEKVWLEGGDPGSAKKLRHGGVLVKSLAWNYMHVIRMTCEWGSWKC